MNVVNKISGEIEIYDEEDGLASNIVKKLFYDELGYLYIGSTAGLDALDLNGRSVIKLNYILDERIAFFKNRCINSLGQKLFNKAYDYLKNVNLYNNTNKNIIEPITIREHLVNLFGKNNIGFWQLIDQILLLENIKNGNSNNNYK